jgi:hypothetical protein
VVRKLAGEAGNTASWCSNVGNEFGQVVMCVITDAEGDCLDDMAKGLVSRYERSHVEPPKVLYVDRDCCGIRLAQQFSGWPNLTTKLDIWHYMRRFAMACCSESHALYGTFMAQLSRCIFEWDAVDVERLVGAKQQQLIEGGVYRPSSEDDIANHVTKKELATHCKRRTRGSEPTAELIQQLITTFASDLGNDTMGIPLLDKDRAWHIWEEQQKHLDCIQDPAGVQLYTQTGTLKKGGVELPVYRCALVENNKIYKKNPDFY